MQDDVLQEYKMQVLARFCDSLRWLCTPALNADHLEGKKKTLN